MRQKKMHTKSGLIISIGKENAEGETQGKGSYEISSELNTSGVLLLYVLLFVNNFNEYKRN